MHGRKCNYSHSDTFTYAYTFFAPYIYRETDTFAYAYVSTRVCVYTLMPWRSILVKRSSAEAHGSLPFLDYFVYNLLSMNYTHTCTHTHTGVYVRLGMRKCLFIRVLLIISIIVLLYRNRQNILFPYMNHRKIIANVTILCHLFRPKYKTDQIFRIECNVSINHDFASILAGGRMSP